MKVNTSEADETERGGGDGRLEATALLINGVTSRDTRGRQAAANVTLSSRASFCPAITGHYMNGNLDN